MFDQPVCVSSQVQPETKAGPKYTKTWFGQFRALSQKNYYVLRGKPYILVVMVSR